MGLFIIHHSLKYKTKEVRSVCIRRGARASGNSAAAALKAFADACAFATPIFPINPAGLVLPRSACALVVIGFSLIVLRRNHARARD